MAVITEDDLLHHDPYSEIERLRAQRLENTQEIGQLRVELEDERAKRLVVEQTNAWKFLADQRQTEIEQLRVELAAERERCAQIADSFRCGLCGMDGKASAAIRKGE